MDLLFNEENLARQLSVGKCVPFTDKEIDLRLISTFRENIPYLIYEIKENDNPQFVKKLTSMGIKVALISRLDEEAVTKKKMDYLDFGLIKIFKKDENFIKRYKDKNNIYYKSIRGLLSDKKIYASTEGWKTDSPIKHRYEASKCQDFEEISYELDALHILKKLD